MSDHSVRCDGCGKMFRWKPELAGKRAKCACGNAVVFPVAAPQSQPAAAAPAAPSARSSGARLAVIIAAAVCVLLVGAAAFLFKGGDDIKLPPGAGTQNKVVGDVTFLSFDAATDLVAVNLEEKERVQIIGDQSISSIPGFKLFRAHTRNHWVFLWPASGKDEHLQGVFTWLDGNYALSDGAPASLGAYWPPVGLKRDSGGKTWDEHLAGGFELNHAFGAKGRVFVATVRHPTDDATRRRAAAFIDEAITRPRALHHVVAIASLMRAAGVSNDRWHAWLAAIAAKSPDQLISESQPAGESHIGPRLMETARRARVEAAITLALLTDFRETQPLADVLKDSQGTELAAAMLHDAVPFIVADEGRVARFRALAKAVPQRVTLAAAQVESGLTRLGLRDLFERIIKTNMPADFPAADDPQVAQAVADFLTTEQTPHRYAEVASRADMILAAEAGDSPRIPALLEILRGLDGKAFVRRAVDRVAQTPQPWPQWMYPVIDGLALGIAGRSGSRTAPKNPEWAGVARPHADRFVAVLRTVPDTHPQCQDSLTHIIFELDAQTGKQMQERIEDARRFASVAAKPHLTVSKLIRAGDLATLTRLVDAGAKLAPLNPDPKIKTLLFEAARSGRTDMLPVLERGGLNVVHGVQTPQGAELPFDDAISAGRLETASALLDRMIERPAAAQDKAHYQLLAALRDKNLAEIPALLAGTKLPLSNFRAVRYAVALGDLRTVIALVQQADFGGHDDLLRLAIRLRHDKIVAWLIDPNTGSNSGASAEVRRARLALALTAAIEAQSLPEVERLFFIRFRPEFTKLDQDEWKSLKPIDRVLAEALQLNRFEVAQWALTKGADVRFDGNTQVFAAELIKVGVPVTRLWVYEKGAALREGKAVLDEHGKAIAAVQRSATGVDLATHRLGFQYLAAFPASIDKLKELLDSGFDVNNRFSDSPDDKTLLMYAVMHNNEPAVRLLLERKADVQADGGTILDTAIDRHPTSPIIDLLVAAGAKVKFVW